MAEGMVGWMYWWVSGWIQRYMDTWIYGYMNGWTNGFTTCPTCPFLVYMDERIHTCPPAFLLFLRLFPRRSRHQLLPPLRMKAAETPKHGNTKEIKHESKKRRERVNTR
jgi:hypothetical protein